MGLIRDIISRITWRLVLLWGALLGALWLFVEFTDQVYERDGFSFDEPILNWFYTLINPVLTDIALFLSTVGDVPAMLAASLLVTVLLALFSRREAIFFSSSMAGASLIMVITKFILARPRPELFPDVDFWEAASPSFPSGHATGSMAFFLTLFLVSRHLELRGWRALIATIGLIMVLGISTSRLYLQVHYPSDILAGLALGAVWVLGTDAIYHYQVRDRSHQLVLLKLPAGVVNAYHEEAERRGIEDDEVVAEKLGSYYGSPPNVRNVKPS